MQNTIARPTAGTDHPLNHLDRVWSQMSSADRHALLGHDGDELTAADKVTLAKLAAGLRKGARRR